MTVLPFSYGITMDHAINAPGHENIVVNGLNAMDRRYLKEQMELIGESESNNTPKIGMLTSASQYVFIKIAYQCIHIINNE